MENTYFVVTQVKSNRLVFFTDDPEYRAPFEDDLFYVTSFKGRLPEQMNLGNCWRWRFNGGIFEDTEKQTRRKSAAESLLDYNRAALRRMLTDKINTLRRSQASGLEFADRVRDNQNAEARAFKQSDTGDYPYLRALAAGNGCSLAQAADFALKQSEAFENLLLETQATYEIYSNRLNFARTEEELYAIRQDLMKEVAPGLSRYFAVTRSNTQPPIPGAVLEASAAAQEKLRLSVQLSERIKALRHSGFPGLPFDEWTKAMMRKAAYDFLDDGRADSAGLMAAYSASVRLPMKEAASKVLADYERAEEKISQLEVQRLGVQARINELKTDAELTQLNQAIWALKI